MKIGFYAPMKAVDHAVPSGDREMARRLVAVLGAAGFEVTILSDLRAWEGRGDGVVQRGIREQAAAELMVLERKYATANLALIFVYHVYHKAPDWLGCPLAATLGIPYVIAEASYAPSQSGGKWQLGQVQTEHCLAAAQLIIALNPTDLVCVCSLLSRSSRSSPSRDSQRFAMLQPFLDAPPTHAPAHPTLRATLAAQFQVPARAVWLVCVAMMRAGDKCHSYQKLAQALRALPDNHELNPQWCLLIIGDGAARAQVEDYFQPLAARCRFIGQLSPPDIGRWLQASDVFVWPAVNEAYGLAMLEAMAAGLPVVAQDFGGVATVVQDGVTGYLVARHDEVGYTAAIQRLITDANLRQTMAAGAREKYHREHRFADAVTHITALLRPLLGSGVGEGIGEEVG